MWWSGVASGQVLRYTSPPTEQLWMWSAAAVILVQEDGLYRTYARVSSPWVIQRWQEQTAFSSYFEFPVYKSVLFPPLTFRAENRNLLFTILCFPQCKVTVAVSKKINLIRPNPLSSGVLEVMAGRTGEPVCYSLAVKVWKVQGHAAPIFALHCCHPRSMHLCGFFRWGS